MLYPNIRLAPTQAPPTYPSAPVNDQLRARSGREPARSSLMLLGLGERLAISVLLSGAAFLSVAWALA
jgi:hypothetical protein